LGVGGGKFELIQFRPVDPPAGRAAEGLGCAVDQGAGEEFQMDRLSRVSVRQTLEQGAHGDFHAQFLADFPDDTGFPGFARFPFAAGKLP